MPTISLTDTSSLSADLTLLDDSVIGKTPVSVLHFLRADIVGALGQTLDQVQIASLTASYNYNPFFSLSGGTASFSAGGGITGELDLYKPAAGSPSPLFPADQYGADIEMNGSYYLALSFQLSLQPEVVKSAGAFTLVPSAGFNSSAKLYLPFARTAGVYPSLKDALASVLEAYRLPSSIADMTSLPPGAVFVYDAQGSVAFDAEFDLLAAINPTASLGASFSHGPIAISAGPSVTVGGGFSLSGEFQVRMWNKDGKVIQLGYYKKRGSTFDVSFDASAGVTASVGGYDVIAKIYGLLGSAGTLDAAFLSTIPTSVAGDVEAAYEAAVQRKLSIAIDEECDTTLTEQAAFSWDFDSDAMGAEAEAAFHGAILGRLTPLMARTSMPAGVTKVGSVFDRLKDVKHTFNFNFLGLFDYASVRDASLEMTVKASDNGQVVIADTATLVRLQATATPLVKGELLRKVLTEDFIATVGYSTSLGTLATDLEVSYSYYDYLRQAHVSDLQIFVSTAAILAGESDPRKDWAHLLSSGMSSQGASMLASLTYDNSAAVRLFLDGSSSPRTDEDYQKIGLQALLLTPGLGLNSVFVGFLQDYAKWQTLVDAGAIGNFYAVMGVSLTSPPQWATVAYAWKQHVILWASSMHSAAQALQDVRQYIASHPGFDPLSDATFSQKRKTLASQLATAVQQTPLFNDSLGVNTIYLTARPTSEVVNISYCGKAVTYS